MLMRYAAPPQSTFARPRAGLSSALRRALDGRTATDPSRRPIAPPALIWQAGEPVARLAAGLARARRADSRRRPGGRRDRGGTWRTKNWTTSAPCGRPRATTARSIRIPTSSLTYTRRGLRSSTIASPAGAPHSDVRSTRTCRARPGRRGSSSTRCPSRSSRSNAVCTSIAATSRQGDAGIIARDSVSRKFPETVTRGPTCYENCRFA